MKKVLSCCRNGIYSHASYAREEACQEINTVGRKQLSTFNFKLLTLNCILLCLFFGGTVWGQTTVEIGDGGTTNNTYLPGYNFYDYSLTQQIYTDTEIGMAGTINSIAFKNTGTQKTRTYNIYMLHTDKDAFSSGTDWVAMSSGDLVFSGELTFTVNAWTTIDLDNPFAYDGSSNLLVGVADVTGDYTSSPHMACLVFNATSQAIRAYRDNTAYNITAPGVTGTVLSVKNQIELKITPSSAPICYTPRNLESVLTPGDGTVATLNWERHANGTENNWVLEYSTNSNFSGATSVNVSGTPTANLTGLAAETTYYARVKANCGGGSESGWTSTCEFTPTNVYAITVNDGSSTNGNVPIYGLWCDDITKSQFIIPSTALSTIQYGTINKLTFYSSNASVSWGSANFEVYMTETNETSISELVDYASMTKVMTAGSLSISGNIMEVTLSSPYQYLGGNLMIGFLQTVSGSYSSCSWYGVTATGASMGGYGTSISQQNFLPKITIEYTPSVAPTCPKPTNLTVSNVEARSAQLSWTAGGSETAWQICVNDDEANPISVTTNPYTLTGLTPETTYNVKVRANCGGDYSAWTSNSSFTTPIACPAPTSLTVSNVDTRSAQLSWTAGGSETAWQICINGDEAHPISVTTNPYTLTGLTPETDYDVKVRANCGGGDYSTWTSNESFTTLIACPAPTGLAYSDIEPGAATISWDDASVSGYNLRYGKAYTFDDGTMQGWTTIDADGDGYNWMLGSAVGGTYLVEGASLAGSGHNSSADLLSSGSFENVNITALTPDNYLVSPRINFGSGASIGFWACAQDVDFQSEHFGIAISTNGNTDPSDFTTIRECTFPGNMTREQSSWKYYEVDLSSYSGQGYVAIRHFNCTDMFMLNIDDITITQAIVIGATSPYLLGGLDPATTYGVQAQSDCDSEGLSSWCSPVIFTTGVPTKIKITPSAADEMTWAEFAGYVNDGYSYSGKTVTLMENIVSGVTDIVGTYASPIRYFSGTFDGGGHTLTVNISSLSPDAAVDNNEYKGVAPFRNIRNATIKDLVVTGSVTGNQHHTAGLVGFCADGSTNTIQNCLVHTNVTNSNPGVGTETNNYIGGIIGHNQTATTTIEGCVYDGTLTSEAFKGGMIGFSDYSTVTIQNSYFGGNYSTSDNFSPIGCKASNRTATLTFDNFYYNKDAGDFGGNTGYNIMNGATPTGTPKHGYTITGESPVTVAMNGSPTEYDVSGINAYSAGIVYDGDIIAGDGDNVALTLGGAPSGYYYEADYGTLTGSGSSYTLAMTGNNTKIYVVNCLRPENLGVSANNNSITITWDDNSASEWQVAVHTSDDGNPGSHIVGTVSERTYTVSSLASDQTRYLWVRAYCSASDQSVWIGPVNATTQCTEPTSLTATPFSSGAVLTWDSGTDEEYTVELGTPTYSNQTDVELINESFEGGSLPDGWTSEGSATWSVGTGDYSSSTGACDGDKNAKINHTSNDNVTYLVTPAIDLNGATSATLSCCYINRSWSGDVDGFGIYYRINGGSWTELFSTSEAHSSWTSTGDISLSTFGANFQLGFKMTDNYGYGVAIDKIVFSVTGNLPTGDYTWTPVTSSATMPYTLTGLTMGNTYYVRVKDQCDNTSDVVAFSPACTSPSDLTVEPSSRSAEVTWLGGDSYNLRYRTAFVGLQEGFSSAPSGWLFRTGALNNDGTASLSGTSSWSSGTSNNVFDSHIYMNFYSTKNYWLITPSISIQDDCLFNFDVAYTAYSGSNATPAQNCTTHRFAVLISTDNMESWTILREWNNNGSSYSLDGISTTGDNVSISLSSYAGQTAYIAFFAHSETTSYDNNIHFDNVKIGKAPGSWMPSNSGTSASSPYTISNLSPETAYDVQVQATCEGDWNTSATFTTTPLIPYDITASADPTEGGTVAFMAGPASGTTVNTHLPLDSYYHYGLSEQIYTPAEIGGGAISSIAFYSEQGTTNNGGIAFTRNIDIYMAHTNKSAFDNTNDWISVSSGDKVFSGTVTFNFEEWTTITFSTPFNYNGTSNLVLVVDDNTGDDTPSGNYLTCRAFTPAGGGNCSLFVRGGTNYDPTNPTNHADELLTVKNQILINPGSSSLTRIYPEGATCTVVATANDCYDFVNWTENDTQVSTDSAYSFTVTGDRNLVANFNLNNYTVTVEASPSEGGSVTGGGTYGCGNSTANLEATANTGYYFYQWADGNTDNPRTVNNITSDVTYTAIFKEAPHTIASETDWNNFAEAVSYGYDYNGEDVTQTADITVSTMVGGADAAGVYDESIFFKGTFDGGCNTITFNKANATEQYTAPFRRIDGATIQNVKVTGTVSSSNRFAGCVVAYSKGTSTVTNCINSTSITSTGNTHGGIVGMVGSGGTLNISGCVFNGTMSSGTDWSGILGLCNSGCTANISNCLFIPASVSVSSTSGTIFRSNGTVNPLSKCYYTQTMTNEQGDRVYSVTGGTGVDVSLQGSASPTYSCSGLDFYASGLTFNGTIYGSNLALSLGYEGLISGYTTSNGVLTGTSHTGVNDEYTLASLSSNAIINQTPCPFDNPPDGLIWKGGTDGDITNWEIATNWAVYNESETRYQLAGSAPSESSNVFIIRNDACNIVGVPSLSSNQECNDITLDGIGVNIADSKSLTVNGTANFISGIVNGDMAFGASASSTGAKIASHVNGTVTKTGNGSSFVFPTGNDNVLGTITATVGSGKVATVKFNHSTATNADGTHGFTLEQLPRWWNINDMCSSDGTSRFDHVSNYEYWNVTTTEALSGITLIVDAADAASHFSTAPADGPNENICAAAHYNCWKNLGGSANVSEGNITVTGVNLPLAISRAGDVDFSGILTLGSKSEDVVLPIELTSFTATCDGRSALVEWTTATERNNDYFSLERSDDAINFVEIARVAGAGNSIESIDYAYTDYGIHGGDNYYRLVQVDYDGTRTVSDIVLANCVEMSDGEPDVMAYPNPFNDDITVVLDNFGNRVASIEVYDMLGRLVMFRKADSPQNNYEMVLHLGSLPPATYNIRVSTADFVINKQVVKN